MACLYLCERESVKETETVCVTETKDRRASGEKYKPQTVVALLMAAPRYDHSTELCGKHNTSVKYKLQRSRHQ